MSRNEHGISESEHARQLMDVATMFKLGRGEHLCLLGNQIAALRKPFTIRQGAVQY